MNQVALTPYLSKNFNRRWVPTVAAQTPVQISVSIRVHVVHTREQHTPADIAGRVFATI